MDINLFKTLSEKQRKLFLGQEAIKLGWGGISSVSKQYQVSRATVSSAVALVKAGVTYDPREGERKKGGGRKPIEETYPEIETIVISLVKESSYGSPSEEKAWTTLSAEKIKEILESEHKIVVCPNTVRKILRNNHYSRQQNKKMLQVGEPDPNRDKQFENIKRECEKFKKTGDPILSGDTKKKRSSAITRTMELNGAKRKTQGP